MAETWYAIVEETTGRLLSTGSVVAPILPLGIVAIPINGLPDSDQMWSEQTQQFVPRPPKVFIDRLDDLRARPGVVNALQALTAPQRQAIVDAFIWLLGRKRYRVEGNSETL